MGNKSAAIKYARKATAILPIQKDYLGGTRPVKILPIFMPMLGKMNWR
jgi:hypothetical protein